MQVTYLSFINNIICVYHHHHCLPIQDLLAYILGLLLVLLLELLEVSNDLGCVGTYQAIQVCDYGKEASLSAEEQNENGNEELNVFFFFFFFGRNRFHSREMKILMSLSPAMNRQKRHWHWSAEREMNQQHWSKMETTLVR